VEIDVTVSTMVTGSGGGGGGARGSSKVGVNKMRKQIREMMGCR